MGPGEFELSWRFISGFLSIVLIDLVLAGDNAVVIAMAVRSLPRKQRIKGIIFGAGAAVVLRVGLTFVASQLLTISFIKFAGGALITWIAIKLFVEGAPEDKFKKEAKTLRQAIFTVVLADLVMSTDNILAVAGASHGNLFLLLFGLGLSIPFVVFTSNLLSMLMDRFPIIIYLGAAVLGRVAGEMLITDPYIEKVLQPGPVLRYTVEGVFTVGVIVVGKLWLKWQVARRTRAEAAASPEERARQTVPDPAEPTGT
jgi:YjbE family integral membrane protein